MPTKFAKCCHSHLDHHPNTLYFATNKKNNDVLILPRYLNNLVWAFKNAFFHFNSANSFCQNVAVVFGCFGNNVQKCFVLSQLCQESLTNAADLLGSFCIRLQISFVLLQLSQQGLTDVADLLGSFSRKFQKYFVTLE
jgi:hypothetical protein